MLELYKNNKRIFYAYLSISSVFLLFYLQYALKAWFLQDDFGFIKLYDQSLMPSDILQLHNNFGRFVTRNLYWYSMLNFFGRNATMFYLVNFLVLILNFILAMKLVKLLTNSSFLGFTVAIIYLTGQPVLMTFAWISNSQHLLAHSFIFLLLYVTCKYDVFNNNEVKLKVLIVILFIFGLYSNTLTVFAVPMIFAFLLTHRDRFRACTGTYLTLGILTVISSVFVNKIKDLSVGAYKIDISWSVFINTLYFYLHNMVSGVPMKGALLMFFGIYVLLITYMFYQKDRTLFLLITGSIMFYLPFAFMVYQTYMNYIAISYFFLLTAIFYVIKQYQKAVLVLLITISLSSSPLIKNLSENPYGASVQRLVDNVTNIDKRGYHTIIFKPVQEVQNTTEVKAWDIPDFWWKLGFGDALYQFSDSNLTYKLFEPKLSIKPAILVTVDQNLKIKEVVYNGINDE